MQSLLCTENGNDMFVRWTKHNHDPDPVEVKAKLIKDDIMESAAKHPHLSTGRLKAEWQKKTLGPDAKSYLPSKRTMRRKLQRFKQEVKDPACLRSFADLADMQDKFKQTFDGQTFLLANLKLNEERIIIYASKYGLTLIQHGEIRSKDGTFSVVPKPFTQLYSFMSEIDGYAIPR